MERTEVLDMMGELKLYGMKGHCHGARGLHPFSSPVVKRMTKISYRGYRFPPEIIQQAIWLYLRFTLSLRDVEDLLAERGVPVSYETVRRWVNHFGPMIAADLRKWTPNYQLSTLRKRHSANANSADPIPNSARSCGQTMSTPAPRNRIACARMTKCVSGAPSMMV